MIRQGLTKEDQEAFASVKEELRLERLVRMIARSIERSGRPAVVVYTVDEVAGILKVKRSTVGNLIHRTRELSACKVGRELRIREEDLRRFLASRAGSRVKETRSLQ